MGARKPDLVSPPPSPFQAVTVGEMRTLRWIVTADCRACRTRIHVDLAAVAAIRGNDFVLWGARPRCKVWVHGTYDRRCEGRVALLAQSNRGGSAIPLSMTNMVRDAIALREQAKQQR